MRPGVIARLRSRVGDVAALLGFVRTRRSLYFAILVAVLLALTFALFFVQTAAVAPYLYSLF